MAQVQSPVLECLPAVHPEVILLPGTVHSGAA